MAQSRLAGNFGLLYKYVGDTTNDYIVVGCATSNGFNSPATINEQDVNKCDPQTINKEYGGINQSIDFEGHIVTDADKQSFFDLLADQEAQTKVVFKFDFDASPGNADTYVRYFTGLISDISSVAEVNTNQTWSMTLDVDGLSSTTDPMI